MAKNNMDQDILKVLFSEQEIHDRIQEMGDQLYDKFHDRDPLFVGVLNGCFLFMADLVRATQCKSEVEFIGLSSYQNATKSSGVVQITRDLQRETPPCPRQSVRRPFWRPAAGCRRHGRWCSSKTTPSPCCAVCRRTSSPPTTMTMRDTSGRCWRRAACVPVAAPLWPPPPPSGA